MKSPNEFAPSWTTADDAEVADLEKSLEDHFGQGNNEATLFTVGLGKREEIYEKLADNCRRAGWVVVQRGGQMTIKKPK